MRRRNFLFLFLIGFLIYFDSIQGNNEYTKNLFKNSEAPTNEIHEFTAMENTDIENHSRNKRAANSSVVFGNNVTTKVIYLNDTHKQLMVRWVGEDSNVIVCLARDPYYDPTAASATPSAVFISYNDGNDYENKTSFFKLSDGINYATIEKFYNHPKFSQIFVFTDIRHNVIYLTRSYGKTIETIPLSFTPTEISFLERSPSTFLILDKNDTDTKLWFTEDYGKSFQLLQISVKSFFWLKDGEHDVLFVERKEPSGLSTVIYSEEFYKNDSGHVYMEKVQDFIVKKDYIFTTVIDSYGKTQLYVSYKLGKRMKCLFDTTLNKAKFLVADVSDNRAFVVICHSERHSNLYVSNNLNGEHGKVSFTLSLENVFAFFPNISWKGSWLQATKEEGFADIYKVEGLSGIYIASVVVAKDKYGIGPEHIGSLITFDHGATWRKIKPPAFDLDNQSTGCVVARGCSLHLSQRFSQLYPESRWFSILSSKSAPGLIIATGVMGTTLKGHYGIYVSVDAGQTWSQVLHDLHFFNIGDHGGILTAVRYYKDSSLTRHILYSIDEGVTWNSTKFHENEMSLYGLMTQPGENTTIFTMFGSLPAKHQWIIVRMNFSSVFKSKCRPEDYKPWTPSQSSDTRNYIPCVMGRHITYQKRLRNANCLNGADHVKVISTSPCFCDVQDFECDFGFKKSDSKFPTCIQDFNLTLSDPYQVPDYCEPGAFYPRTKGYRKIANDQCIQGFENHYLPDIIPCPFNQSHEFLLFAQRENISTYNLVTGVKKTLPIKNLKNVIAVDYDLENNCVFWGDINLDTINRQCFSDGSKFETLVSSDIASIEGMAYDWITHNLYFVDGFKGKIALIRTDSTHKGRMRKTILDKTTLKKPRGIALHPLAGYLFWTDWSVDAPSVSRADMNGKKNLTLFGKDVVEWPNGITVDYIANRIYWVDARLDYIGSSDLHGDGLMKIVKDSDVVSHPFAIAVFKSVMYWDDWKKNAIYSSNKDVYKGVDILIKDAVGLMDLKVFAHGKQIGKNACSTNPCSYICVGLPNGRYECLCPDGMEKHNDTCLCPGGVEPIHNITCPSVNKSCSPEHLACANGNCVPLNLKCDGEDDCGDNSDEFNCRLESCPPNSHICGDGRCLPHYWVCDSDRDCEDGSDELNCTRENCTENHFTCNNGRCISKSWLCDGENDCRDNSDEIHCTSNEPIQCKDEEFHCKDGSVKCVPNTWKCDGESDCRDGSDEHGCENNVCPDSQFSCGPPKNSCIFLIYVCDGDDDCSNGADEKNCSIATPPPSTSAPDPDKIDIKNKFPKGVPCRDWMFTCENKRCLPFWWKCDGTDDCGDRSDELGCDEFERPAPIPSTTTETTITTCPPNMYQCLDGSCIFNAWVCDTRWDCKLGEDEALCDHNILYSCDNKTQFKCNIDGSCIGLDKLCDGHVDCPDKTDELYCTGRFNDNKPANPSCSVGFFPCDGSMCYPLTLMCDGRIDCHDRYDEQDCENKTRVYQVLDLIPVPKDINSSLLSVSWRRPANVAVNQLEYLPSISKVGENKWTNESWSNSTHYTFSNLEAFTDYNVTVYVRDKKTKTEFPPAKYYVLKTFDGIPSSPFNVQVKQHKLNEVIVTWDKPLSPNGELTNYMVLCKHPNSRTIEYNVGGTQTYYLMTANFQHNETYIFTVIAYNKLYGSEPSQPKIFEYDGKTVTNAVHNLTVINVTNTSATITWNYTGQADSYYVTIAAGKIGYPYFPRIKTKSKNYTINRLAPGTTYLVVVQAVKKNLKSIIDSTRIVTLGDPLPYVEIDRILPITTNGNNSIELRWNRPESSYGNTTWIYGIYYGATRSQLANGTKARTTNLSASISNIPSCETLLVAIGLVGPYGDGPLSRNLQVVKTHYNSRAPPKDLEIRVNPKKPFEAPLFWKPNCFIQKNASYDVAVIETNSQRHWNIIVKGLNLTVSVERGGSYMFRVATNASGSIYSQPITYTPPGIPPPIDFTVYSHRNGSYAISWNDKVAENVYGKYQFEVLVHDGSILNERTALRFLVDRSPFFYTNHTASQYAFAVRLKTEKGYRSHMSNQIVRLNQQMIVDNKSSVTAIVVVSLLITLALAGVITFLVIRNRRLQNSFTRFANSHYNPRSGAATFDDTSGLEEDEPPRVVGFSDDEPLVVA